MREEGGWERGMRMGVEEGGCERGTMMGERNEDVREEGGCERGRGV